MTIRFLRRRHTLRPGDGRQTLRLATRTAAANSLISRLPDLRFGQYKCIWPSLLVMATEVFENCNVPPKYFGMIGPVQCAAGLW